ncbi:hypothetical protein [Nitrosomonas sp. sh817]|nr:hypothetical protein [Nitrosomonas sp. sh817]WMJ09520.1 hypothetical protein RBH92_04830 [Nitrosomonas sp. sh817]
MKKVFFLFAQRTSACVLLRFPVVITGCSAGINVSASESDY